MACFLCFVFRMCHADEYRRGVYNQAAYFILTMQDMDKSCEPKNDEQEIASNGRREGHQE